MSKLNKILNKILNKSLIKSQMDLEIDVLWDTLENIFSIISKEQLDKKLSKEKIIEIMNTGLIEQNLFQNFVGIETMAVNMLRDLYVQHYGFVALNKNLINYLSSIMQNDRVIEVGAGTGFLAKHLQEKNINLLPVDNAISDMDKYTNHYGFRKTFTDILETDAINYFKENKHNFDTILMVWPPLYEELSSEIFKEMSVGQKLIYIGESKGGCTGNDDFFNLLSEKAILDYELSKKTNGNFTSFSLIKDNIYIYEKTKE